MKMKLMLASMLVALTLTGCGANDKEEKAVFQVTIYNDDYVDKRTVAMTAKPINREIEDVTSLNAARLVEIYKKDQLKDGKLKEIASRLNEEDNPVIMLVKQKNKR